MQIEFIKYSAGLILAASAVFLGLLVLTNTPW